MPDYLGSLALCRFEMAMPSAQLFWRARVGRSLSSICLNSWVIYAGEATLDDLSGLGGAGFELYGVHTFLIRAASASQVGPGSSSPGNIAAVPEWVFTGRLPRNILRANRLRNSIKRAFARDEATEIWDLSTRLAWFFLEGRDL